MEKPYLNEYLRNVAKTNTVNGKTLLLNLVIKKLGRVIWNTITRRKRKRKAINAVVNNCSKNLTWNNCPTWGNVENVYFIKQSNMKHIGIIGAANTGTTSAALTFAQKQKEIENTVSVVIKDDINRGLDCNNTTHEITALPQIDYLYPIKESKQNHKLKYKYHK